MSLRFATLGHFACGLILFLGTGCLEGPDAFGDTGFAPRDGAGGDSRVGDSGTVPPRDTGSTSATHDGGVGSCPGTGLTRCAGECVDTRTDDRNCGECNVLCIGRDHCIAGSCSNPCAASETFCGGVCVDVRNDVANCGACGARCGAGESCLNGSCAAGRTGAACINNADCGGEGLCLLSGFGWSGGYCSFRCTSDADCGGSGWCMADASGTRLCLRGCTDSTACRSGYSCQPLAPANVCVPSCSADPALACGPGRCIESIDRCNSACGDDSNCSTGSRCDTATMQCRCTAMTDCGSGMACIVSTGRCGCATDSACGSGHTCDRTTGRCR